MARTPSHQISQIFLPPINTRTTYDDAYHEVRQYRPSSRIIATTDPKLLELETRLDLQEKTTQQLLDRAVRIKQDLMENLSYTKGTWQEEKVARELLQEHVRTITAVVRQMNKEIKSFETEVKEKENSIHGTGNAIKTLESHHVAGITDLRGRVARCDAALAKLGGDIRQANDSIRMTNSTQQEDGTKLVERIQSIDGKLTEAYNRLEKLSSEHMLNVKMSEEALNKGIYDLENRTKQTVDELRGNISNASCATSSEIEKMESRMAANLEKNMNFRDVRMEKLDADHHEFSKTIQDRLGGYEKDHTQFKIHVGKIHKDFEVRLNQYADTIQRQQTEDLHLLKREMREGFGTVHDTINNMKSVMEGKQKLLEENLRREMAQIRKMVVLI